MKYLIFDAGPNGKNYKLGFMFNNTLSPRCYPKGYAGLYALYFNSLVSLRTHQTLFLFKEWMK